MIPTPEAFREALGCPALGPRWVLESYARGASHVVGAVRMFGRARAQSQIYNAIAEIRAACSADTPFFAALLDAFGGTTR